ncbi:MAG: dehydrogenase, partial [Acidobacteria bacterium]|nr:dehydrogenase [Acidobacteriota bacterium]
MLCTLTFAAAADWPEWRGAGRQGVWDEAGIIARVPAGGLRVKWRSAVGPGYSGPAVSGGRVFVLDRTADTERILSLDETTGRAL